MSFNLIEYYKAISGESSLEQGEWHVSHSRRHACQIYSDIDIVDSATNAIKMSPNSSITSEIKTFSNQLNQKFENAEIVEDIDGTERVELKLDDRIVTLVIDNSGSMTWNDNGKFRYQIARQLVQNISSSYPGNVRYNLFTYGGSLVNTLLFGVVEEAGTNLNNLNSISRLIFADSNSNYSGVRVIRNEDHYPSSITDGEEISDGFISRILSEDLEEGKTYYYKAYTYNNNLQFSAGTNIKVTTGQRDIPRGVSIFKTFLETEDLTVGSALIGRGVSRDSHTIGIWHMDEGVGKYLFDFSDNKNTLEINNEAPSWLGDLDPPAGISGLIFDGDRDFAFIDNKEILEAGSTSDMSLFSYTVAVWVYPYDVVSDQAIMSSYDGDNLRYLLGIENNNVYFCQSSGDEYSKTITTTNILSANQWVYLTVVSSEGSISIYVNGILQSVSSSIFANGSTSGDFKFTIGASRNESSVVEKLFYGKITEASIHNTAREISWIEDQLVSNNIYDKDGNIVDTYYIGRKGDNGDRLVVLKYEVPEDYNFSGGNIKIIRNERHIPSWEEDGTEIYSEIAYPGQFYVCDAGDFVLGESYYYRIYSQNALGNFSFYEDSPSLTVFMEEAEDINKDDFIDLLTPISGPAAPLYDMPSIVPGNRKIYVRWRNPNPTDDRVKKVKIYHSSLNYPNINKDGSSDGNLVFTGEASDDRFVHRNLDNDQYHYYSVVFIDKYGRPSNYYMDGTQSENFYQVSGITREDADESLIPLDEVSNIHYEIYDENSATIIWDPPQKNPDNISAYFDQTVIIYASITDQFGRPVSDDTPIKMRIAASINRQTQADNVFDSAGYYDFDDNDAYNFSVSRTSSGILKATLRMSSVSNIISQIKDASFIIQLKAYIPKDGYSNNEDSAALSGTNPLEEYAAAIEEVINEIEGGEEKSSSSNIFEYYSQSIEVSFTNPWEIELINKDETSQKVSQQCYVLKTNEWTKRPYISRADQEFNGVYMGASDPFVARAKVKYKGEPVDSGFIQISVWDADFSDLCRNAGEKDSKPYEGPKIAPSKTVFPPNSTMQIIQGTENINGQVTPISYVDIPLYAPNKQHAVRLYVKGSRSGYSSIKELYVLFQSILKVDFMPRSPSIDGKDVAEQKANFYLINPDYPDNESLRTYPVDNSVVEWKMETLYGDINRSLYSIDSVPLANGIYSYTRTGTARNVFFGPVSIGADKIDEVHKISATIVYNGMSITASGSIDLEKDPLEYDSYSARFLMEVDGKYDSSGSWINMGWLYSYYVSKQLWADGSDYVRLRIARNPNIATDFNSYNNFITCASQKDLDVMELSSGQIVMVSAGENVEILHGEIYEELDPYTGRYYLRKGEEGFVENGVVPIQLNSESVSNTTYFYIRTNQFTPHNGSRYNSECKDISLDNDCTSLGRTSRGLTDCDVPLGPIIYVSGETTVFLDDQPLVLYGGGGFDNGIPPCPICLREPLSISTIWRKVVQYRYIYQPDDPSVDYVIEGTEIEVPEDDFLDEDGKSYIQYSSDVLIRVKATWRGDPVPEGTPIYVSINNYAPDSIFLADRSVYLTKYDAVENYSYVDIVIQAVRPPTSDITESVEVFVTYDELEKVSRRMSVNFSLTLNYDDTSNVGEPEIIDPSVPVIVPPEPPHNKSVHKYDIQNNEWTMVGDMSERRGYSFCGSTVDRFYVIGGLKDNTMAISSKTEMYSPLSDEWSYQANMITPRFGGMSVTVGNDIYTIGGIARTSDKELYVSRAVEVYHTDTNTWEEKEPLPISQEGTVWAQELPVAFGTASYAEVGGKGYIYVMSGVRRFDFDEYVIQEYNDSIMRYSIEDDEWEYTIYLRTDEISICRRIAPQSLVYDDKLIVFGGAVDTVGEFSYPREDFYISINASSLSTKLYTDKWIHNGSGYMGTFPEPKYLSSIVKYDINPSNDEAIYYIFGGSNSNSDSLNISESITIEGSSFIYENSYNNSSNAITQIPIAKHGMSAGLCYVNYNPYIIIAGGFATDNLSNPIDIGFDL